MSQSKGFNASSAMVATKDKSREELSKYAILLRQSIQESSYLGGNPTHSFYTTDPTRDRAEKIHALIAGDILMSKLKTAVLKRLGPNPESAQNEFDCLTKRIGGVFEELRMKEMLSSIGISLYEKVSATAMLRSPFDTSLNKARMAKDETVLCIREVRMAWEEGINEELQAMAVEMKRPFARVLDVPKHPLLETSVSVSVREKVRFLFDSEDLLETAAAIRDPNMSRTALDRSVGMLKIPLLTPSLQELSKRYHDFHIYVMQLGLDELSAKFGVKYNQTRHVAAEDAINNNNLDVLSARKQLRCGAPPSLRGMLWRVALGLSPEPTDAERQQYEELVAACHRQELLTDDLYIMDVLSVSDDPTYFVFDDNMREVALCFSRDSAIPRDAEFLIHAPLYLQSGVGQTQDAGAKTAVEASPPNGIQPFLGFAKYIAPVCYCFLDNVSIYTTLRAMYCRLWCAMNVITSNAGTLYHVCQTFERLLLEGNIRLYSHLKSLKVEPLQVAMSWLQLGFVGLLEVEQTLILWDRLIGYMDTTLLAVLAAAVFQFRSEALLLCTSDVEVLLVLSEGSRLKVVPLLQMYLMSHVQFVS